ncbi:MAG: FixH family protein [Gammaproteobacteria bacterium]|nr:FixH family protein [Gammaproteobacteria bacterium]TVQ48078.1 MAG: nitrogen fixation protein FixH [Gammaproteobacteria bacterium]
MQDESYVRATEATDTKPWYRQRWPWLVMIPPAGGVFAGLSLLFTALASPNPMVVDDYSRIARYTEARMERDRAAAELGLSAELRVVAATDPEDASQRVEMVIVSPRERLPVTLNLALRHPTRAELDREVLLRYDGDAYRATVEDLGPGRYYLQLEPDTRSWRLTGELGAHRSPVSMKPPFGDGHMRDLQPTGGAPGPA